MDNIDFKCLFESSPGLYLILNPDLGIAAVSNAYLAATMTDREKITGHNIFEIFPDNPDDSTADGVSNLRASLNKVLESHIAHAMAVQKYDIRRPDGSFEERFWSPVNKPVFNTSNELVYIIHSVEDVTDFIRLKKEQNIKNKISEGLSGQVHGMEIEIYKRAQEIQQMNLELEKRVKERTAEIAKSEKRFRALIENNYDVISLMDESFKIIYRSPSAFRISGFTDEEMKENGTNNIHPDDVEKGKAVMQDLISNPGQPIQLSFRSQHKLGHYIWLEGIAINLLHDEDIKAVVFNFRDVTERIKTEDKLVESEKLYRYLFTNMLHGFAYCKAIYEEGILKDYTYVAVNSEYEVLTGLKDITGKNMSALMPNLLISDPEYAELMNNVILHGKSEEFETYVQPLDKWFSVSLYSPEKGYFVSLVDNITDRKEAEQKILKANRLYAFISQINQNIVHVKDEESLFRNSCQIALDFGKFKMAWIGKFDTAQKNIKLVDHSGIAHADIHLFMDVPYGNNGPQDHVLSTGIYYVCNNIQDDLELENWKSFAKERGINSCMVLPIMKSNRIFGTFNFYSAELNFFNTQEINLLTEVTGDISFALDIFEKVRQHKETEELVINNERRFRAIIEKSSDIKTISGQDGGFVYGSPSITKILGYTSEEFLHKTPVDFIHPDDINDFVENRKAIKDTLGESFFYQLRLRHKNGNWIWCEGTTTNMLHEKGIQGFVSNFRDISERKAAEFKQIENENLVKAVYTASLDSVIIIDQKGIITKWDDKSELLFGWTEKDVLGIKLSETIIPERYREMHEEGMQHYLKTGEGPVLGKTIEISALKKNGIEFDVSLSITPSQINGITHFIGFIRDISEKKIVEQQREFDKKNLDALINNTTDLMWSVDKDFNLITYNQPFNDIMKLMSGNAIEKGTHVLSAGFTGEQLNRYKNYYERAFAGKAFSEIEYTETPELWSEISFYPIRKGNNVIGTACHSRNITHSKKAELQLKQSEIFNRGVLNSLSAHIAVIDETGNIINVNDAWKRFALENGETNLQGAGEGSNYFNACKSSAMSGDEVAADVLHGMEDVLNAKRNFYYIEYPCHAPDKQRWFAMRVLKFESDEPMIVVSHQDITERKLAQEAMSLTQFAVDNAGDAIFWMAPDARIVDTNEAACHLLGYAKEEFLSLSVPDIDPYYDAERWVTHYAELREKGSLFFETIQRAKDGRLIPVEIRATYIKFGDKALNCAFVRDISERKKTEENLKQQNEELTKTNFELDRFVYSVSHDLRSPLTSVLGLLSFIEEDSKEPDTLEYAEMIRTNINRLDDFIKNILNYSRNKRTELKIEKVSLQKTVDEIVDSLRNMKDAEGIDFEVNLNEHQPFYSDIQTFSTIMENLIANAIKFQKEGVSGRYIKIKGSSDKHKLKLTIEDNGIGIAPEHQDNIFNMFFRLSGKTGGTGIGLYIVKEMIRKLQGSISVNSTPGTGTSFNIKIKNLVPANNPIPTTTEPELKKSTDIIQNFIVLDDDPVNNTICIKIIKKVFPEAYVLIFTEPDTALAHITSIYGKKNAPNAVLFLDINMPLLSGWDFLEAFDRFDIRIKAHLKIYMLTSSFDQRDKKRALENKNVLGYFEKPLNREKVKSVGNMQVENRL